MKDNEIEIDGVKIEFVSDDVLPGEIPIGADESDTLKNAEPVIKKLLNLK